MTTGIDVRKTRGRRSTRSAARAANSGPRWSIVGADSARRTRSGTFVGPGIWRKWRPRCPDIGAQSFAVVCSGKPPGRDEGSHGAPQDGRRCLRCSSSCSAPPRSPPAVAGPRRASRGVLTLALAEDPDPLDPTTSGTFVSRIVYVDMCEKLYDVGPKLQIVPQLATALPTVSKDRMTLTIPLKQGVRFNDGTPFDAQAVKTTFEHYLTYKESSRAGDLAPVKSIEVVDPHTVRLHLKAPSAPLLSLLADRAGMILSPTQLKKLGGAKFATNPVCVGAFKYTDRVARRPHHARQVAVLLRPRQGPPQADHLQDHHRRPGARLEPALGRRRRRRAPRALRRRLDQGRLEHPPADDDVARLPGHHDQQRQHGRHRQAVPPGQGQDAAGRAPRAARGVRGGARPRRHQQGRLLQPGHARLRADLAREPVVRQGPDVRRPRPRQGARARGEERRQDADPGQAAPRGRARRTSASGRSSRRWRARRASRSRSSRASSRPPSTAATRATSTRSRSAGRAASTPTATSSTSSRARAR